MSQENELKRLEGFVSSLLERFNGLQQENSELADRLQRREATIETLQGDLAEMKNERGEISSRVGTLIGKIEEWEAASGISTGGNENTISDEKASDSGVQGNLFFTNAQTRATPE